MRQMRSFARFWWDFVVGDDWRVAAGVVVGLALTSLLAGTGDDIWWFFPLTILLVLIVSLWREARRQHQDSSGPEHLDQDSRAP